jgi:hypothetical protein
MVGSCIYERRGTPQRKYCDRNHMLVSGDFIKINISNSELKSVNNYGYIDRPVIFGYELLSYDSLMGNKINYPVIKFQLKHSFHLNGDYDLIQCACNIFSLKYH